MPTRLLCPNCGNAQRKANVCGRCGAAVQPVDLPHSGYGIAMYVAAAIGGVLILVPFLLPKLGLVILVAVLVLVVALALNVADDRRIDTDARTRAGAWAAQARARMRPPP